VSLQTHDQVGNRATGDRLSESLSPGLLAAGAALLLTGPATPMLFMGEEWGASTPWQYFTDYTDRGIAEAVRRGRRNEFESHGWDRAHVPDPQSEATVQRSRLDWSEVGEPGHARLLEWYSALVRLRRERPELGDPRLDLVEVDHDTDARTVVMRRGTQLVVLNLSEEHRTVALGVDDTADLEVVLAWEPDATRLDGTCLELPAESAAIVGPPD